MLLGWTHTCCGFLKKEYKLEGNWSSAGHPHPRDGVVIGTFRAFAAAHGHCAQTGFGAEQKMLRAGIAAINLLNIGGSNFSGELGFAVLHLCPSLNSPSCPFAQAGLQLPLAQEVP